MNALIIVAESAFFSYSSGKAMIPVRTQIKIPHENGISLYMPGYIEDSGTLDLIIVSVFRRIFSGLSGF
jgi:ornithine cyclodeaminase